MVVEVAEEVAVEVEVAVVAAKVVEVEVVVAVAEEVVVVAETVVGVVEVVLILPRMDLIDPPKSRRFDIVLSGFLHIAHTDSRQKDNHKDQVAGIRVLDKPTFSFARQFARQKIQIHLILQVN